MYIYIYIYIYIYKYIYLFIYREKETKKYMFIHTYIHISIYLSMCVYIYMHVHKFMSQCVHIYIYASRNTCCWLGSERCFKNDILIYENYFFNINECFGASVKIYSIFDVLLNSILIYPHKNIVNNHVGNKSISILVTQKKKGLPI